MRDGHAIFGEVSSRDDSDPPSRVIEGAESSAGNVDDVQRIYEQTPALLHSINAAGAIEFVTDRWLSHFGYDREEVIGRASTDFLTEESRVFAKGEALPRFFEEGRCEHVPYTWVCKDGSHRDVLLSASSETDAEGRFIRSFAVLQDVTQLREL